MKKHEYLSPPIEVIERQLLGINEGLIQSVIRGETSEAIAAVVRASPEWAQYHSDLDEARDLSPQGTLEFPVTLPEHLRDLIRRRASSRILSERIPEPGQIVLVEKIVTPRPGQIDAVMMAPLHVLLDAPAETPAVWHGWLASGETDYAGWWDFVLQEQDEPFDPDAGLIQLWNPVRLYLPMASRVVGVLSPARMQAVRSLAADFVVGDLPVEIQPWPGRIATRTTSAGLRVTSGSPLGNRTDSRHRYQTIYFEAAEAIREPARLAMLELAQIPSGSVGRFLGSLVSAAARLSECLIPEPQVAVAMGEAAPEAPPDLTWPGIARIRILDLDDAGAGRVEVRAVGGDSISIEVRRNDLLLDKTVVFPGGVGTVSWERDSTHLVLGTPSGRRLGLELHATA